MLNKMFILTCYKDILFIKYVQFNNYKTINIYLLYIVKKKC